MFECCEPIDISEVGAIVRRMSRSLRRGWRILLVAGTVSLAFTAVGSLSPVGATPTSPVEAEADVQNCTLASGAFIALFYYAVTHPGEVTPKQLQDAAEIVARACRDVFPRPPTPELPPEEGNPPGKTTPKIIPPGGRTPGAFEPHICDGVVTVAYGTAGEAVPDGDPSSATIRLDWGDGTSATQTVDWGDSLTLSHNYFFSSSPFGRSAPGQGSDDDPEQDGSDFYPVQATVLETGARSGYAVIDHVGPFAWSGGDPTMPGTT